MRRFKNILVGVDLSNGDQLVAETLAETTNAAIHNGLWLAKHNHARLTFFHALEIPEYAKFVAEERGEIESTLIADCEERLTAITQIAREDRVDAQHVLVIGKPWVELIRQVLRHQHDLVITGTRQRGSVASALFGSTGMKLLRKCPCPVWITKPHVDRQLHSILVADDLSEVGELALELGVSMAELHNSQLHVLHVLDLGLGRREWDSFMIRQWARTEAAAKLESQLARVGTGNLTKPPKVDIVVDGVDTAIVRKIEQCEVDLLLMGTVARGGIAGVLLGNTAERLLPRVTCSVLAVKPHDFICPIAAE